MSLPGTRRVRTIRTLRGAVFLACAVALFLSALLAQSMFRGTITIDGNFSDWIPVYSDSDNVVFDRVGVADPDTNPPYSADRDVKAVAATWDSTYLYFYMKRMSSPQSAWNTYIYFDRNNDGTLTATDYILNCNYNGEVWRATATSVNFYSPASAGGDPVTGDGVNEPGALGSVIEWADNGTSTISSVCVGLETEIRIPWTSIGVAPGSAIRMHFSTGKGTNLPSAAEDNTGPFNGQYEGPQIYPDNRGSGREGTIIDYTHVVTNTGNATDTIDLTASSRLGWTTWITDSASNPISSVTLARDQSTTITARIAVPGGTSWGTKERTVITATSRFDSWTYDTAVDLTEIGALAVAPDNAGYETTATVISYNHTVYNNTSATITANLTTWSTGGWTTRVYDGTGVTTITAATVPAYGSVDVVVKVTVPATATAGMVDVTYLRAVDQSNPYYNDFAKDITTIQPRLTASPNNVSSAGPGSTVLFRHNIGYTWNSTDTINLTVASSQGWSVQVYDSSNMNPISSVVMGPSLESTQVVVRLMVPSGASVGAVDITTLTATSAATPTARATATERTTIVQLVTYADPGFTRPSTLFRLGEDVFAKGFNLAGYTKVSFKWVDSTSSTVSQSPFFETAQNQAEEYYTLSETNPVGQWQVRLLGSASTTIATASFTVTYNAYITDLVATDVDENGQYVYVDSSVKNHNATTISNSSMNYVIWWDSNGNGAFDAGDMYINSSGSPVTYSGTGTVSSHLTSGITVSPLGTWSETNPGWSMSNQNFPYRGNYFVTATWSTSGGVLIDEKTTTFFSVPILGYPLLFVLVGMWGLSVARFRSRRQWLPYCVFGAFGFTVLLVYFLRLANLDAYLSYIESYQVADVARWLAISARGATGGSIVIPNAGGWALLKIGVECSAVLEMAVLMGLLIFYPAFNPAKKLFLLVAGLVATYVLNLVRLLIIVGMVDRWGNDVVFIAHAIVGRAFFFGMVVMLYWFIITRPTLAYLHEEVRAR